MLEIDRRLSWPEGTLQQILGGRAELKVRDLMEILSAAGIEERSFFAALYDLEPRCRSMSEQGEIPYSIGHLSEADVPGFPPLAEVLALFGELAAKGARRETVVESEREASFAGETDLLDRSLRED
jgi:hypothetical protein